MNQCSLSLALSLIKQTAHEIHVLTFSVENGLGDKLFLSIFPTGCSLLHCRLIDLTLANDLSVIYDQTAPESGIYYPLLLSVRQHYITLHCLSQFAKCQDTTWRKFAGKSGLKIWCKPGIDGLLGFVSSLEHFLRFKNDWKVSWPVLRNM